MVVGGGGGIWRGWRCVWLGGGGIGEGLGVGIDEG